MSLEYFQKRGRIVGEGLIKKYNRRHLLMGAARYAALGFVGFITGAALVRRRRLLLEGKCINRGICTYCEIYEDCRLPPALSSKHTLMENSDADKKN